MAQGHARPLRAAEAENAAEVMHDLQTLREALRPRVRGAGCEVQERFGTLDQQAHDLEMAAQATGTAARALMRTLLHGFRELSGALEAGRERAPGQDGIKERAP